VEYKFERFTQTKSSFAPKVTIRKGGYLGISQAAASRYGIDAQGYYGVFFYDKDARVIGVQITQNEKEPGAVKIQWRKHNENAVIQVSIRSFLDSNQIDYSDSISYSPQWDEDHQMIIIDLNKPKESRARQRKASASEQIEEPEPVAAEPVRPRDVPPPPPPAPEEDDPFGINEPPPPPEVPF